MIFQGSSFTYVQSGMPSSSCGVSCGAQTAHGFSHPCRENWLPMALPFNETQWSLPSATRRVSWTVSTACTPGIVNLPPSQVGLHTCQEILSVQWQCVSARVSQASKTVHIGTEEENTATNSTRMTQNCWTRTEMTSFLFPTFFILLFELKEQCILQGNHSVYLTVTGYDIQSAFFNSYSEFWEGTGWTHLVPHVPHYFIFWWWFHGLKWTQSTVQSAVYCSYTQEGSNCTPRRAYMC